MPSLVERAINNQKEATEVRRLAFDLFSGYRQFLDLHIPQEQNERLDMFRPTPIDKSHVQAEQIDARIKSGEDEVRVLVTFNENELGAYYSDGFRVQVFGVNERYKISPSNVVVESIKGEHKYYLGLHRFEPDTEKFASPKDVEDLNELLVDLNNPTTRINYTQISNSGEILFDQDAGIGSAGLAISQ